VAPARALIQPLMDPQRFAALTSTYRPGQRFRINAELARWEEMGYQAVDVVTAQGQYARRGGIVDVFPGAAEDPVRIELFGDEIDSLRRFDPATQRSTARVEGLTVTAVRQYSLRETQAAVRDERAGRGELPRGLRDPLLASGEVRAELTSSLRVEWWTRTPDEDPAPDGAAGDRRAGPVEPGTGLPCDDWRDAEVVVPALTYAGRLRAFLDDTLELRGQGRRVVVATLQSARLSELYDEHGAIVPAVEGMHDAPARGSLTLVQGSLLEGWRVPALGLYVFSDAEIFGWS